MATEQFANAAADTLNGAINDTVTSILLHAVTTFPSTGQFRVLIGSEIIIVLTINVGSKTFTSVTRGAEGTTAASHIDGSAVTHIVTAGSISRIPRAMTNTGDIEYLNSSGAPTRLAAPGDDIYRVKFTSSVPSWDNTKLISKAYNNVAQPIPDSVYTALTFNTNSFDAGGIHSGTVNPTRFTVPTGGDGYWFLMAQVVSITAVGTNFSLAIRKNGTTFIAAHQINYTPASEFAIQVVCPDSAVATDYYEFMYFQASGANLDAVSSPGSTYGSAFRINP